jgi:CRP/FNR family transcriptional regulator, cyclic AMP receptor protein
MTPEKKLELFFEVYPEDEIAKGTTIISRENEPSGMFYLSHGFIRQYAKSPKGEILYLHVYKPGSCFPLMWLFTGAEHKYYYEAVTKVSIRKAPVNEIREFIAKQPDVLEYFTSRLLMGIDGLLTRLESLVLDTAYKKTARLFIFFARTFGKVDGKGAYIDVPLSHKQIAAWIGTARETATLTAEALKKKGLIRYINRRYSIPNLENLFKEVNLEE